MQPRETVELEDATWYCDGSLLHGKWKAFRTTGFGIVVVAKSESLLGFGKGVPPHWCRTAAAAEAWALQVIVSLCPFPPEMRTDCLSLLSTAAHGTAEAVQAKKQLARVWRMLASHIDGNITVLMDEQRLTWMPAHQTIGMVDEKTRSDGAKLSMVDWRANRLVDLLAKQAAEARALPKNAVALLDSATVAVREAAKLLGRVTHAANNHSVTEIVNGKEVKTVKRDAMMPPKDKAKRKAESEAVEVAEPPAKKSRKKTAKPEVKPWSEQSVPKPRVRNASAMHELRLQAFQQACTKRRVEEVGSALTPIDNGLSGKTRFEALKRRLQDKFQHDMSMSSSSVLHDPG
jgi:hypothetical protein